MQSHIERLAKPKKPLQVLVAILIISLCMSGTLMASHFEDTVDRGYAQEIGLTIAPTAISGAVMTGSFLYDRSKGRLAGFAAAEFLVALAAVGCVTAAAPITIKAAGVSPDAVVKFFESKSIGNEFSQAIPLKDLLESIGEEVEYFTAFSGMRRSLIKDSFLNDVAKATGIEMGRLLEVLKRAGSFGDHALNGELIAEQVTHASPVDLVRLTTGLSDKERTLSINYLKMRNLV